MGGIQEIKKIIYVAGPYRAESEWALIQNIRRAEAKALELWRQNWVVICPHKNTERFSGALPDRVWLEGCLEILRRCDAIYLLKRWQESEGAKAELAEAQRLGLEVIFE